MDFTTVTTDEEILKGVSDVLKIAKELKAFIDMPIYHKDFKETAFNWRESSVLMKSFDSYALGMISRKKFTKAKAAYTQKGFAIALEGLENIITNFCPKKYL